MALFSWLRRKPDLSLEHPVFGRLTYSPREGNWVNRGFSLWGYSALQLVIAADENGPSAVQADAFRTLEASREQVLPRAIESLRNLPPLEGSVGSAFVLTGLAIPKLEVVGGAGLWHLWFDKEGDDLYMFGVESNDSWRTLQAYAGD
jgi:hypothetical protein